ncbi:MAG: ABC transporter permease [Actinomycetota bacterium]|nr:ABC transporter permease [Actinomycetota bacterium]
MDTSRDCYTFPANNWVCTPYLSDYSEEITTQLTEHVWITVVSVLLGAVIAFPLALLARRSAGAAGLVLGTSTVLYTIPSLAMFSLLLPFTGISPRTVVIGLALYTLTILVRNILAGLNAVPDDVLEAGRGLGYGPAKLLLRVELPLALPVIMAGVRVATVSTVALVTVGAIVGSGGLGKLLLLAIDSDFKAQIFTASVLCVLLAIAFDVLLLGAQRLLTPWQRARVG